MALAKVAKLLVIESIANEALVPLYVETQLPTRNGNPPKEDRKKKK